MLQEASKTVLYWDRKKEDTYWNKPGTFVSAEDLRDHPSLSETLMCFLTFSLIPLAHSVSNSARPEGMSFWGSLWLLLSIKESKALHTVVLSADSETENLLCWAKEDNIYGTTVPQSICPAWIARMAEAPVNLLVKKNDVAT